ncbi:MAG TPA: hypothetical protein VH275_02375 [Solirubrobacterales bacterium]|jgi:hypothetical protein|nr:hypothetical protein [Solirubrobacterales bacterium]
MRGTIFITAALLALAMVPLAGATELTREEYVSRVEPICKRNTEANKRIFAGAPEQVKAGKLKAASTHFTRAVGAFEKTIGQLRAVPQPPSDEAKLEKWIGYLEVESSYLGRIGGALAQGDKGKAQTLSVRLNRNSNLANNAVLAFGFSYCKIDPSRFG